MKIKETLLVVGLISTLVSVISQSVSVDVDVSGEVSSQSTTSSISAQFTNLFLNDSIKLYWEAPSSQDDVLITEIEPDSVASVTTFLSHTFYAVLESDPSIRAYPSSITIDENKEFSYSFGPRPIPVVEMPVKLNPRVKYINQISRSIGARFKNLAGSIDIWYDDGKDGSFQGSLKQGQETTTNTYVGHIFYFTESGNKKNELARYVMKKEQCLYLIEDPKNPPPNELRDLVDRELRYIEEYKNRTGIPWRHYYGPNGPRPPPTLYMWPTPSIGHIHQVTSNNGYWTCEGSASNCQSSVPLNMKLEVVSQEPKVFFIENFFSDYEGSKVIELAINKLKESLVGNKEAGGARTSDTRTSRNAWLPREDHVVIDTIYKRAGDLLKIDEKILFPEKNAEMLQVVRYENGQKYDSHHDWGVRNVPESRFLTLLLYLNDQIADSAGGETSFPLAGNGRGIKIHGGKGNAVLFYNLLEDGNADELSLHSGTPVFDGIKWVCNLWIWDPKKLNS